MRLHQFYIIFIFLFHGSYSMKYRVYQGELVPFHSQKYLVLLHAKIEHPKLKLSKHCSGSIIDKNWIISATHCVAGPIEKVNVYHTGRHFTMQCIATVGPYNIFSKDYTDNINTKKNVENDLALLKINHHIPFDDNIQPIQLVSTPVIFGVKGIIAGFGKSEMEIEKAVEGVVRIINCKYTIGTKLLCSSGAVRAGSGDSGGPLVSDGHLRGVITQSCTNAEVNRNCNTIYVDIFVNLDWIETVMNWN